MSNGATGDRAVQWRGNPGMRNCECSREWPNADGSIPHSQEMIHTHDNTHSKRGKREKNAKTKESKVDAICCKEWISRVEISPVIEVHSHQIFPSRSAFSNPSVPSVYGHTVEYYDIRHWGLACGSNRSVDFIPTINYLLAISIFILSDLFELDGFCEDDNYYGNVL